MNKTLVIYFPSVYSTRQDERIVKLINDQINLITQEFTKWQTYVLFSDADWNRLHPKYKQKNVIYLPAKKRLEIEPKDELVVVINGYNYFPHEKIVQNSIKNFKKHAIHIQMTKFPAITNKSDFWLITKQQLKTLLEDDFINFENILKKLKSTIIEVDHSELKFIYEKYFRSLIAPIQIFFETSNYCNLKCNECFNQGKKWHKPWNRWYVEPKSYGQIDLKLFKNTLKKFPIYSLPTLDSAKVNIFLTGMGEPFLNKDLLEMVKIAKQKGFFVSFTSNLTIPNTDMLQKVIDAGIDSITCSIDGFTEKVYAANRGEGHFKNVWKNLHYLASLKKRPQVTLNYIIRHGINDHEVEKFKKHWLNKNFGVHLLNLAYPKNKEKFIIAWENNYDYHYPPQRFPCFSNTHSILIDWNGDIAACPCSDHSKPFHLGNINNFNSYPDIKKIKKFKNLINSHFKLNFAKNSYCQGCLVWTCFDPQIKSSRGIKITKSIGGTYFQKEK